MKSLVLLSFVVCAFAIDVQFEDCGSKAGDVTINVEPCEANPCQLKHGSNYTVKITFTPGSSAESVAVKIYGVVAGVPVPFPFDQPDGCKNSGLTCPLDPGTAVVYKATLPILSEYPAIKLFVEWELLSGDDKLVCAKIPVAVVKSNDELDARYKEKVVKKMHWE